MQNLMCQKHQAAIAVPDEDCQQKPPSPVDFGRQQRRHRHAYDGQVRG